VRPTHGRVEVWSTWTPAEQYFEISVDLRGLDVPAVGGLARLRSKRPNQTALTSSRITLNIPGSGIIKYVAAQQGSEYGVIYW
jgi:hypothetical protein